MELIERASCGDLDGVKTLIQQGVFVDTMGLHYGTAVYLASESGHNEVARYLLENGASADLGAKALIFAVRCYRYGSVKLLLEYHADANYVNAEQESAMSVALENDDYAMILLLLQYDAKPPASLGYVAVQLLQRAQSEHANVIQKLVDENFINLTSEITLLAVFDYAFRRACSVELAERILSFLLNDGYSRIEQLCQALYYSAKNNWPTAVSKLLEKGVDVNALTRDQTLLCTACEEGNEYFIRLLLENGAKPNVRNAFGRTPLHCAVGYEAFHDTGCVKREETSAALNVLFSPGENAMDMVVGDSPLISACVRGRKKLLKLLLDHGADPNIAAVCSSYSRHESCECLRHDAMKLLLEYNTDVNARIRTGTNALSARRYVPEAAPKSLPTRDSAKTSDVVQLLLDAGANVNATCNFGETPLYLACSNGLDSAVNKMLQEIL